MLVVAGISTVTGGGALIAAVVGGMLAAARTRAWDYRWLATVDDRTGQRRRLVAARTADAGMAVLTRVRRILGASVITVLAALSLALLDVLATSPDGATASMRPGVRAALAILALIGGLMLVPAYVAAHVALRTFRMMGERVQALAERRG